MDTFEWILVVLAAIAFTSGFKDWRHRKELEEMLGLMNGLMERLIEDEQELAELKGEQDEMKAFAKIKNVLRDES